MNILIGTPASEEIFGTGDRDRISGEGGDDRLYGAGAGDLILGVSGLNHIYGDAGNDALIGGIDGGDGLDPDAIGKEYDPPLEETEQLYGGIGNDWIDGGAGEDSIFGEDGNDYLQSGPGHDYIVGGGGNDLIYGDAGLDQMYGGSGNDFIIDLLNAPNADHGEGLNGEAGDDLLIGSASWNVLTGGAGADVIMGGGQNDVMAGGDAVYDTGGGGVVLVGGTLDGSVDRFVFNEGDGHDSIYGFETGAGGDLLDLSRLTNVSSRNDLYIAESNGNVVVGLGDGSSVLLVGVSDPGLVTADNFIFRSPETDNPVVTEWADYSAAGAAITAGLESGALFRGRTDGPVPYGAVNMRGSAFADVLAGDDRANIVEGGAGDDILEGRGGDDWLLGGTGADVLSGGEGIDVVSYAGGAAVTVDLGRGFASDGDILIGIEGVLGSDFADTLIGGDARDLLSGGPGDDRLIGGAGADALFGGTGIDTADYSGSSMGVTVDLFAGEGTGGHAEGDTLTQVENVLGSGFADILRGDAAANRLEGGIGDDRLVGSVGADVMIGDTGIDTVDYGDSIAAVRVDLSTGIGRGGYAHADSFVGIEYVVGSVFGDLLTGDGAANRLEGGAGDDMLTGGSGADQIVGGEGSDTAGYALSPTAVSIDLLAGTATGGDAAGDTLSGIENLVGSDYADTLAGNAAANRLDGGGGDDLLVGSAGADAMIGGGGIDTADYTASIARVIVNLASGRGLGGYAHADTFHGIENVLGSSFGDDLRGGEGRDQLDGGSGDDVLGGSAGPDAMIGGAGVDTANYAGSIAAVRVDLANGTGRGGYSHADTFSGVENVNGSTFADVIRGDGGANRLEGGAGDDLLDGRGGDDILVGGAGNDRFAFGDGTGSDLIADFVAGAATDDQIDFSANTLLNDFASVMANATQVGSDTVIDLGVGQSLTLSGVSLNALHQDDFAF